jgi:hypothetical protein
MKVKVRHGEHAAVFAIFDKDVQDLAVETCPLLLSMVCVQIQCLWLIMFVFLAIFSGLCVLFFCLCRERVVHCTLMRWSVSMVKLISAKLQKGIRLMLMLCLRLTLCLYAVMLGLLISFSMNLFPMLMRL